MATSDDDFDDDGLAEREFIDDDDDLADDEPTPRVSMLTLALCFLNVAAAVGFAVLLVMDFSKRQEWSHAVFMRDLSLMGLPLAQEADGLSASQVTMAPQRLGPDKLKEASNKRGVRTSEPFAPVQEVFPNRILPQHLTEDTLKTHFKGIGSPVKTLEEEVERLKKSLPEDIAAAAKEVVDKFNPGAKDPMQAKRDLISAVLLPLARTPKQIDDLYTQIQKADGATLDDLLIDAAKRRMLYDLLAPLEFFRPSAINEWQLEQIADIRSKKIDVWLSMLDARLKSAVADKYDPTLNFGNEWQGKERDSMEKRRVIAFMLYTLNQARKPDGTPLYPQGPERVQKVIGLIEDAVAARALAEVTDKMTSRILKLAIEDREGGPTTVQNQPKAMDGFVQVYEQEIDRIKDLMRTINSRKDRLVDLKEQETKQDTILKLRETHLAAVTAELLAERKKTAFQLTELQRVQRQLFEAQVKLADAHQSNLRLEQSIRHAELQLKGEARMSANVLGKMLVFVQLIFSVLAATFAAGIYMQKVDFGWKEPRKDLYLRVPSEIDKRTAAVNESLRMKDTAVGTLKGAQSVYGEVEPTFASNHLWYTKQLVKLRSDPNPFDVKADPVKEVKIAAGVVQVETPLQKPRTGKPVLEKAIPGIEKSYDSYLEELKGIQTEIGKVEANITQLVQKERDIGRKLTGKDDAGEMVKIGMYALLVDEKHAQDQMKYETDYLQPLWVEALDRAELFYERRERLERTLTGMTGLAAPKR